MADTKITALTAITTVDPAADVLPIVDVSDTSMAASGTTKKITSNQILGAGGTATLASATITGDLTVDTSTLKVDSANNRVGVKTATPSYPLHVNGSDSINMLINGATKGIRFTADSSGSTIAGVDSTGNVSYQPLILDGSSIGFQLSASTAMTLNSTGLGVGDTAVNGIKLLSTVTSAGMPATSGTTQSAGSLRIAATNTTGCLDIGTAGAVSWLQACRRTNLADNFDLALNPNGGNVGIGVTPAGTGGCLQLKSGITFPATQVASSDANTLDDYEEGTWTGTIKGGTTDPTTPVTATGRYTKIGRQVYVEISYNGFSNVGASGAIFISGLPFASSGQNSGSSMMSLAGTFTNGSLSSFVTSSGTNIEIYVSTSGAGVAAPQHNAGTGRSLWVGLTYTI